MSVLELLLLASLYRLILTIESMVILADIVEILLFG